MGEQEYTVKFSLSNEQVYVHQPRFWASKSVMTETKEVETPT